MANVLTEGYAPVRPTFLRQTWHLLDFFLVSDPEGLLVLVPGTESTATDVVASAAACAVDAFS